MYAIIRLNKVYNDNFLKNFNLSNITKFFIFNLFVGYREKNEIFSANFGSMLCSNR